MSRLWLYLIWVGLPITPGALAQDTNRCYVEVAGAQASTDIPDVITALTKRGYKVQPYDDGADPRMHVRVGPYGTVQAEAVRARIAADGFLAKVVVVAPTADLAPASTIGMTAEQQRTEAAALAKFGGGGASQRASGADLEALALAKLGGSSTPAGPQTPAEIEAQAIRSMQANTAQAEVDAANRKAEAETQAQIAALQAQADANTRAASQANTQSTAATFLNGLAGVLNTATDQMAANQQATEARNTQLNEQARMLVAQNEARRAAQAQEAAQAKAKAAAQVQGELNARAATARATVQMAETNPAQSSIQQGTAPETLLRSGGVIVDTLCPKTGFVPGVMRRVASDVFEGVPCVPGAVIYINGAPQFSTAGTTYASGGNVPANQTGTTTATNSGSGSSVPIGTTLTNPAQCHEMDFVVPLDTKWTSLQKTEVVGFLQTIQFRRLLAPGPSIRMANGLNMARATFMPVQSARAESRVECGRLERIALP